jgi:hypothetical protein
MSVKQPASLKDINGLAIPVTIRPPFQSSRSTQDPCHRIQALSSRNELTYPWHAGRKKLRGGYDHAQINQVLKKTHPVKLDITGPSKPVTC